MYKCFTAALLNFYTVTHIHTQELPTSIQTFPVGSRAAPLQQSDSENNSTLTLHSAVWSQSVMFHGVFCVFHHWSAHFSWTWLIYLLPQQVTFSRMTFCNPHRRTVGCLSRVCAGLETKTHQGFQFKVKRVILRSVVWRKKNIMAP